MVCCGSAAVAPGGDADSFKPGSDKDLSEGPKAYSARGCTDIPCLILFLAHLVLYMIAALAGAGAGNPSKLIMPRDSYGQYCGIETQWEGMPNGGADLTDFGNMIFTLNLTESVDAAARTVACSSVVKNVLVPSEVTTAVWDIACGSTGSTAFNQLSDAENYVSQEMTQFTTAEGASKLLTGEGGSSILGEVTKYFYEVCVTSCDDAASPTNRPYVFEPSRDSSYYPVWEKLAASTDDSVQSLLNKFSFNALPTSKCPYEAKLCVPLPATHFTEVSNGFCSFKMDSDALNSVSDGMKTYLEGLASSSIAKELTTGLDNAVGEIQSTWGVFILVAFISFVTGLIFLVLLRFFVKPVVWISILCVFLLFVIGGSLSYGYSSMCKDSDFTTTASQFQAQAMNGTMTSDSCGNNYEVESEDARTALMVFSFILWVFAILWCFLICCMLHKIKLAIAINQVAAMFVYQTPHVVLLPLVQIVIAVCYSAVWMILAAFLLSQVPSTYVPSACMKTWKDAMGDADNRGKCNDMSPSGSVYKDEFSDDCKNDQCCWRCSPPRYMFDSRFSFALLSFLWNNALFVAIGQCVIAGAVGVWFFTQKKDGDRKTSRMAVTSSLRNTFVCHIGSLAFGSLILALVQLLKYIMKYLSKQSKAQKNKFAECVFKCLAYLLWCFEKCVKFLNKNAYIQIALLGSNFCKAAKDAFYLILNNAVRFGALGGLGMVIHAIGKLFVTVATAVLGFLCLQAIYPEIKSPVLLTCIYACMGYVIGSLYMNVFGLAVDTTLQCFIATEEMGIDQEFIPSKLRKLLDVKGESSGCFGCC